jgi:kynurenine formamidase
VSGEVDVSAAEFRHLFETVRSWGRWGDRDERGALNEITPAGIAEAAKLVRGGEAVTLSRPLDTKPAIDNPEPAEHRMTAGTGAEAPDAGLRFAKDYIGVDYHNDTHSHIDALCHVAYDGKLYNNADSAMVTDEGARVGSIEALRNGLVGRGVLFDIPRLRGVRWLEPGEHVHTEDLEQAERGTGATVGPGTILLVRTGHARRLAELGPWDTAAAKAGLHPTAARFLADRQVAALGSDGNNDTAPSTTEGVGFPIHVLALNAIGIHLLDYLQFEDLTTACDRAGRWEFLFVAAPLRIVGGTGSPLNPIAIL